MKFLPKILLKGVFERGKSWETQVQFLAKLEKETGYKFEKPKILTQVTVQFAHFQLTGERAFGDCTGMERKVTFGRTLEEVSYEDEKRPSHLVSGHFGVGGLNLDPLKGPASAELGIDDFILDCENIGVAVCRKF